jgi:DnaB-like helicase N terminal domain/Protein of unknown function (DUF3987)
MSAAKSLKIVSDESRPKLAWLDSYDLESASLRMAELQGAVDAAELERKRSEAGRFDPGQPDKEGFPRLVACAWLSENEFSCDRSRMVEKREEPPPVSQGKPWEKRRSGVLPFNPPASLDLPRNPDAEQGAIAGMLREEAIRVAILAMIGPESFFELSLAAICHAAKALQERGEPVDLATMTEEIRRSSRPAAGTAMEKLSGLFSRPSSIEVATRHAEIVKGDCERRASIETLASAVRDLASGRKSPSQVSGQVREMLDRIDSEPGVLVDEESSSARWPDRPAEPAWHGVVGELVAAVEPETEADPVAILIQLLVLFGNVIGRTAHWTVGATKHYCNEYVAIVGQSSRGRKGTACDIAELLIRDQDLKWAEECIKGGLTSGAGLLKTVRDPRIEEGMIDPGVTDKRAVFIQPEFSSMIGVMGRDTNDLCGYIREAWDGKNMSSAVKKDPMQVTNPHISIIGHTSFGDLKNVLTDTCKTNGFANRFLWVCARRSKELPHGGDLGKIDLNPFRDRIAGAIRFAGQPFFAVNSVPFDQKAYDLWSKCYSHLTRPRVGTAGSITDRAEAHVRRLGLIYAVLDRSRSVKSEHLNAALAVWDYCERSVRFIFSEGKKDDIADKILTALCAAGKKGMTRTEVNKVFHGRKTAAIEDALKKLLALGMIAVHTRPVARTTVHVWTLATNF